MDASRRRGRWMWNLIALCSGIGAVLLLLVGLGSAAYLVAVPLLGLGDVAYRAEPSSIVWAVLVSSLAASTAVVLLTALVAALVLRASREAAPLFGRTALARLLGLGVIAYFFRESIGAILRSVGELLGSIWLLIPNASSRLIEQLLRWPGDFDQPGLQADVVGIFFEQLQYVVSLLTRQLLTTFPLVDLVLILAAWAVVGRAFGPIGEGRGAGGGEARPGGLVGAIRGMDRVTRCNMVLFLLVAIALYLSVAAIVTIPWLQEFDDPTVPTSQALRERLVGLSPSDETFAGRFPADLTMPADGTAEGLGRAITEAEGEMGAAPDRDRVAAAIAQAKADLEQYAEEKIDKLNAYRGDRNYVLDELARLRERACSSYQSAGIIGNGRKERLSYFQRLEGWYEGNMHSLLVGLQYSKGSAIRFGERQDELLGQAEDRLRLALADEPPPLGTFVPFPEYLPGRASPAMRNALPGLPGLDDPTAPPGQEVGVVGSIVPSPPPPGLDLGPFNFVAGWLLRTRSLALSLIIGMLGFGLLGSAVSTFVREQSARERTREDGGPLVTDLTGVVFRGFSATIVVFLAAVGGLAIFGSGQADPNPYVLFFGCLVGAVFSQEVWAWARNHFLSVEDAPPDVPPATPSVTPDDQDVPPAPGGVPSDDPDVLPAAKTVSPAADDVSSGDPNVPPARDEPKPDRRSRSDEQRREAVRRLEAGGSPEEVAGRFGVTTKTLRNWQRNPRLRPDAGPG
ncbi:transposase [Tautonia plasticadhaerens]|uniref:transposase n=1 Tax=Tautonia plasticadhaerens TaxID=2527974 RepID=UPI0011A73E6E|nr:transposase [Tautonia plasticadhaerens]